MVAIENLAAVLARELPSVTPASPSATSIVLPPQSLDFAHYPTSPRQQGVLFIVFLMPALAFVTVFLRVFNRITTKSYGMDDTLIIAAMVGLETLSMFLISEL